MSTSSTNGNFELLFAGLFLFLKAAVAVGLPKGVRDENFSKLLCALHKTYRNSLGVSKQSQCGELYAIQNRYAYNPARPRPAFPRLDFELISKTNGGKSK
jgi:hypothetical protein